MDRSQSLNKDIFEEDTENRKMPLIEEKNRINPSGEVGTLGSKTYT